MAVRTKVVATVAVILGAAGVLALVTSAALGGDVGTPDLGGPVRFEESPASPTPPSGTATPERQPASPRMITPVPTPPERVDDDGPGDDGTGDDDADDTGEDDSDD